MNAPEPVFEAPWHAQLFALTVHLNEAGRFAWPDWAGRFSATLRRHGVDRDLNGGDDYFHAWLETLETYLFETGTALPKDVSEMRDAWEQAYLSTPHGETVFLSQTLADATTHVCQAQQAEAHVAPAEANAQHK